MFAIEVDLERGDCLQKYSEVCFAVYKVHKRLAAVDNTAQHKGAYHSRKREHSASSQRPHHPPGKCGDYTGPNGPNSPNHTGPKEPNDPKGPAGTVLCGSNEDRKPGRPNGPNGPDGPKRRPFEGSDASRVVAGTIRRLARVLRVRTHPDRALPSYGADWFQDVHEAAEAGALWVLLGFLHVVETGVDDVPRVCLDYSHDEVMRVCTHINCMQADPVFQEHSNREWWR